MNELNIRTSKEFVKLLENYIEVRNISLRSFAKSVGIPHSTIIVWKNKHTLPSAEYFAKIAKYMNVSIDYLVFKREEVND